MRRCAFTLVELLVVIGIISVLVSILLPALTRARESAYAINCASNLRQIGASAIQYANEFRSRLPQSVTQAPPAGLYEKEEMWVTQFMRYLPVSTENLGYPNGFPKVYKCPSMTTEAGGHTVPGERNGWTTGAALGYRHLYGNYAQDFGGYGMTWAAWPSKYKQVVPGAPFSWWREARIRVRQPAEVVLMTDSKYFTVMCPEQNDWAASFGFRHYINRANMGKNYLFFDGHVTYISKKDVPFFYNTRFWAGDVIP